MSEYSKKDHELAHYGITAEIRFVGFLLGFALLNWHWVTITLLVLACLSTVGYLMRSQKDQ